jgi:DNA-binding transcriptional LysR family regulator
MDLAKFDLNSLRYFSQVVEYGGFSAAERALGVSKSRLSRGVGQLEAELGVRLLQRSTRRLALTEAGQLFYARCQAMLGEARAAVDTVQQLQAVPRGSVRVSIPVTLSQTMLTTILPEFLGRYPQVNVVVRTTNRVVDLYGDAVDVALRVRAEQPASAEMVARPLWSSPQMLVASPALVARLGVPTGPADLARFPTLAATAANDRHVFHLIAADGEPCQLVHEPRLVTADMLMITDAARAGVGVAELPEMLYGRLMARGDLIQLLPEWRSPETRLYVVFLSRQAMMPAVRAFIDFLVEKMESGEGTPGKNCPTMHALVAHEHAPMVEAAGIALRGPVGAS